MSWTKPTLNASGTTFAQYQAGGLSGVIEKVIAANSTAIATPSAPTISATGGGSTGGTLQAGTYNVVVTETNGIGETTASTAVSVTVAAGNIPQITFAALQSGSVARNVYATAVGGSSSGPFYHYADNVTASTLNMATAYNLANSYAFQPPTTNGTAITGKKLELIRNFKQGLGQRGYDFMERMGTSFAQGDPTDAGKELRHMQDAATAFAVVSQACNEIATLVNANTGHITTVADGIGHQKSVRVWP